MMNIDWEAGNIIRKGNTITERSGRTEKGMKKTE